ncbi:MAG: hypothetical protein WCO93_11010 [bacterium]
MAKKILFPVLLIIFFSGTLYSQKSDTVKVKRTNHYSLTVGLGWTHYINNLEIGADEATTNSLGVSLKFFWEPEHRLSLGLESGFYRLYKVKSAADADIAGDATMSAIPLLLVVRMRIVDQFYLSAGAGLSVMFNKVNIQDLITNSTILSLSNYQFSGSYLYPVGKHWGFGGEFKLILYGKATDWIYTLQALCVVKL